MKILVAEDNRVVQEILRQTLLSLGHQVEVTEDGATAVAMHAAQRFNVILMDLLLVGLDGLDATRQIRAAEEPGGRRTIIIAITGEDGEEVRMASLAAGVDDFLIKPVNRATLGESLVRLGVPLVPPLRDWTAVEQRLFTKLAPQIIETTQKALVEIGEACVARDVAAVKRLAHSTKGGLAFFGASRAQELTRRIEEAITAIDWPLTESLFRELQVEAPKALQEIQLRLNPAR